MGTHQEMLLKKMPLISLNQPLFLLLGNQELEENLVLLDLLDHLVQKEKVVGMDLMVWTECRVHLEMFSSFLPILAQAKDQTTSFNQSFLKPCKILWDLREMKEIEEWLEKMDLLVSLVFQERWAQEGFQDQEASMVFRDLLGFPDQKELQDQKEMR